MQRFSMVVVGPDLHLRSGAAAMVAQVQLRISEVEAVKWAQRWGEMAHRLR
jgi:hypothetical protein